MTIMTALLAVILAAVELGTAFGGAAAEGSELTAATMEVEIVVSLSDSDGPVIAHLGLPGEPATTRAMAMRGPGRWGTILELRRADWRVVFEDVATGDLSEEASLTDLGLDPALLGLLPGQEPEAPEPTAPSPPWGWLVAALVALVAAVALVRLGARSARPRHLRRRFQPRRSGPS